MSIFGFGGGKPPTTSTAQVGRGRTNTPVSAPGPTSTAIGAAAGKAQPRNPTVGGATSTTPQPPDAVAAAQGAADAAKQASLRARRKGVGASAETMLSPGGAATPGARLSGRTLLGY